MFLRPTTYAQTPIPRPIGECGFEDAIHGGGRGKTDFLGSSDEFSILISGLCEQYTYEAGWEETMDLHLGKGAEDYLPLIEQAVKAWNETIRLPSREPLIEIVDDMPSNFQLSSPFWDDAPQNSRENIGDGESVIYFKPSQEEEDKFWGFARVRWQGFNEMIESDVYINTSDEEEYEQDGKRLALTKLLVNHDDQFGIYAFVNKTYLVILHELGHSVGLKHIPVTGNVMSRDFMPGTIDQWAAPMSMYLVTRPMAFEFSSPWNIPFMDFHEYISRYMTIHPDNDKRNYLMDLFTRFATPGEQEKMALACVYEY